MPSHHDKLQGHGAFGHGFLDALVKRMFPSTADAQYGIDDLQVNSSSVRLPAANSPSWATWNTNHEILRFQDASNEYVHYSTQLPHSYKNGTDLLLHVHFVPLSGSITAGQTVIFKADIAVANVGSAYPATTTYTMTYTAPGTVAVNTHLLTSSVTIPGSSLVGSAIVFCRMYRDGTTDTYTGNVGLLAADYHIRKSRIGSATENPST